MRDPPEMDQPQQWEYRGRRKRIKQRQPQCPERLRLERKPEEPIINPRKIQTPLGGRPGIGRGHKKRAAHIRELMAVEPECAIDRKSTRLNSSHLGISYAVFCLKKKRK